MQSGDIILEMYGYAVDTLHHTPSDAERSVHVLPSNPASEHSVAEDEHN